MISQVVKVSIIVPIYNAEKHLKECIDSIVAQTLKDIEIILVDDGSSDSSAQICKQYLNDTRIKYFYKNNEGVGSARQFGLEKANGLFIGFVDSDDWIEPNMFERMYAVAVDERADIVIINYFNNIIEKQEVFLKHGVYDIESIKNEILPRTLAGEIGKSGGIRFYLWLRLFSMNLIKKHNITFDNRYIINEDLPFIFKATLNANRIVSLCNECYYHYRKEKHHKTLTSGYLENYWIKNLPLIDDLYQTVLTLNNNRLLLSFYTRVFYWAEVAIENEFFRSHYSKDVVIKKLDVIAKDRLIKKAVSEISYQRLNIREKMIYNILVCESGSTIYEKMKIYRYKKQFIIPAYSLIVIPLIKIVKKNRISRAIRRRFLNKKHRLFE